MTENYKMFFNTGVKPCNLLNKNGETILLEWQVIKGGVMQIIYFLERKPEANLILKFLAPKDYLNHMQPSETAIKIVGGGMLSDYAIFQIINKKD